MAEQGLIEVPNPSALFLAEREAGVSGAAVFAGMEGSRPLLVEVQALVGPSPLGTPRRTVVGWDGARSPCCSRSWRRAAVWLSAGATSI